MILREIFVTSLCLRAVLSTGLMLAATGAVSAG
jgi:hypothetical protein